MFAPLMTMQLRGDCDCKGKSAGHQEVKAAIHLARSPNGPAKTDINFAAVQVTGMCCIGETAQGAPAAMAKACHCYVSGPSPCHLPWTCASIWSRCKRVSVLILMQRCSKDVLILIVDLIHAAAYTHAAVCLHKRAIGSMACV